jgi:hypothetical protein
MYLVNSTTDWLKRTCTIFALLLMTLFSAAQDNSPYARYGLGDLVPNHNMTVRGMGGIAAGFSEFQSINLTNPAAVSALTNTVFDIGGEVDIRTLKSTASPAKYRSTNTIISYLQVGFPVASKKMQKNGYQWGFSFGMKPITRISYKIEERERVAGIDSFHSLYEGSGGLNQVFVTTALKHKGLSFGASVGYNFGNKDISTRKFPVNDSVIYYKSNTETHTRFGGVSVTAGLQYDIKLKKGTKKEGMLRLGAYGSLQNKMKAKRDFIEETFEFTGDGGASSIDTATYQKDFAGKINIPSNYGIGFTYGNKHWLYGADFEIENWSDFREYGKKDATQNTWKIRAGAQFFPAKEASNKYFNYVRYRAGFYYGPDYIKLDKARPEYMFTFGAGLPLTTTLRGRGEFVILNAAVELGGRGSNKDILRENIMRFSFGISMNARWFIKPKYD